MDIFLKASQKSPDYKGFYEHWVCFCFSVLISWIIFVFYGFWVQLYLNINDIIDNIRQKLCMTSWYFYCGVAPLRSAFVILRRFLLYFTCGLLPIFTQYSGCLPFYCVLDFLKKILQKFLSSFKTSTLYMILLIMQIYFRENILTILIFIYNIYDIIIYNNEKSTCRYWWDREKDRIGSL